MQQITEKEFEKLSEYIKKNYGIFLKKEKMSLVMSRLSGILSEKNMSSFSEYYQYVVSDRTGLAAAELVNKITTNHTFFMREPEHFTYFRDVVLPYLSQNVKDKDLRIWSAGCSSGEEPYTLAMIMNDYFGSEKFIWDTKILATDISGQVLESAKNGIYSMEKVAQLSEMWKRNYFHPYGQETYQISQKMRDEIIFRRLNLNDREFPFRRKFHVIFCRNVMIYFDSETKRQVVEKFYDHMENGGFLFIGHSESLNQDKMKYKYIMPALYRKE
ncbi:MAG TPA: protein-glutamate O-methyltransferase CheR [Lachnospiraceae bacterium]|nr:protein-glutamate O-methyltransferase CheR [Lachnospiraceae bacterium]